MDQNQHGHAYGIDQQHELQQKLNNFWENQYQEIEQTSDFRKLSLPLDRIKKIMKACEEVKMVSAEATVMFAKACEMFIMELTMRAWINAEEDKRRTLQNNDIAAAITRTVVEEHLEIHNNNMDQNQHGQLVGGNNGDHYIHQQQQHELQQQLINNFWANQYHEIEHTTNFKKHSMSLARIKKIMKTDKEVKMVSPEAPIIFAKACEMFIMELTMKAWANAEENKRRTLQNNDIVAAITGTDVFDFLADDVVPIGDTMDHEAYAGIPSGGSAPIENVPYNYMPPQHVAGPPYAPPHDAGQ